MTEATIKETKEKLVEEGLAALEFANVTTVCEVAIIIDNIMKDVIYNEMGVSIFSKLLRYDALVKFGAEKEESKKAIEGALDWLNDLLGTFKDETDGSLMVMSTLEILVMTKTLDDWKIGG